MECIWIQMVQAYSAKSAQSSTLWSEATRNAVFPGAEIDLIAQDGRVIVFIEVKMRTGSASYGREAVTSAKQKRICKGALLYMAKNNLTERQARFDVIEIRGAKLTHIKDAFPYRGPMF